MFLGDLGQIRKVLIFFSEMRNNTRELEQEIRPQRLGELPLQLRSRYGPILGISRSNSNSASKASIDRGRFKIFL